jgi:[acyl-carrier-protein] S-malonyltransferase
MEKIAFLFPGQGSHYVGMAKTLYDQFEIAKQTFEEANDVLGFDLANICFTGSLLELNKMPNMFPAILVSSVASFRVYIQEIGVLPQFCAGHSLGEYSALTCAGVISYADALKMVWLRGVLAQELADMGVGAMTILDGVNIEMVAEACKKASSSDETVFISCYNSPNQVSISGCPQPVQRVEDMVQEDGGQISPIIGGAPFHSPLMNHIAEKFQIELDGYTYGTFRYPVISNVHARPYGDPENVADLLPRQLISPVQWQKTMQYLQRFGITVAIEMGPKNVLSNLVTANTPEIEALCFGQKEDRRALNDYFSKNEQLRKHVPTVITRCLAIAVSTPNTNWNQEEYQKGVIEPYRRIQAIQDELDRTGECPTSEQMREALEMLKCIFATKRVPVREQIEWFNQIFDETGTNYLFKDFEIPLEK